MSSNKRHSSNPPRQQQYSSVGSLGAIAAVSASNSILSAMSLLDHIDVATDSKVRHHSHFPQTSLLSSIEYPQQQSISDVNNANTYKKGSEQYSCSQNESLTNYLQRVPPLILDELTNHAHNRNASNSRNQGQNRRKTAEEISILHQPSQSNLSIINSNNIETNNNQNNNNSSFYGKLFQQPSFFQKTNSFHMMSTASPSNSKMLLSQRSHINSKEILGYVPSRRDSLNQHKHKSALSNGSSRNYLLPLQPSSNAVSPAKKIYDEIEKQVVKQKQNQYQMNEKNNNGNNSSSSSRLLAPVPKMFISNQKLFRSDTNAANALDKKLNTVLKREQFSDRQFPDLLSETAKPFAKNQGKQSPAKVENNNNTVHPPEIQDLMDRYRREARNEEAMHVSDLRKIVEKMQHEFSFVKTAQNTSLKKQSGERQEAVSLAIWADATTMEFLKKQDCSLEEFISEFERTYRQCVLEVSRQVSNDCFERGQLLERLWETVFLIMKEFVKKGSWKQRIAETAHLAELNRLHGFYNEKIASMIEQSRNLQQLVDNKDALLRNLYQQKEATKKKAKQSELVHQILLNDYDFLERHLESIMQQNLQLRFKVASHESMERVFIKDTDPKKLIKQEMNVISSALQEAFAYQFEEEKSTLQDVYEIRKESRLRAQAAEKTLDLAFRTGMLEKKTGIVDVNGSNKQLNVDEQYGTIEVFEEGTDTDDLFQFTEETTDTNDLVLLATTETMTYIDCQEKEIQATAQLKEVGTQADIKRLLSNQNGERIESISVADIMKKLNQTRFPLSQISEENNFQVGNITEDQFIIWKERNKELCWVLENKDEYGAGDFECVRNELQSGVDKVKEFTQMLITLLNKEQEKSRAARIQVFETKLDNEIVHERQAFATQTLKRIIPKYNQLKKENSVLNQNQSQLPFARQNNFDGSNQMANSNQLANSNTRRRPQPLNSNSRDPKGVRSSAVNFATTTAGTTSTPKASQYSKLDGQTPKVNGNVSPSGFKRSESSLKLQEKMNSVLRNIQRNKNNRKSEGEVTLSSQFNRNAEDNAQINKRASAVQLIPTNEVPQQEEEPNAYNADSSLLLGQSSRNSSLAKISPCPSPTPSARNSPSNEGWQSPENSAGNSPNRAPKKSLIKLNSMQFSQPDVPSASQLSSVAELSENQLPRSINPRKSNEYIDKLSREGSQISSESELENKMSNIKGLKHVNTMAIDEEISIEDQMYDKKYLDENAKLKEPEDETNEFENALKNLDNAVSNILPTLNINSRMRTSLSSSKFTENATEYLQKSIKDLSKKKLNPLYLKLTQILRTIFNVLADIVKLKEEPKQPQGSPTNKKSIAKTFTINHFHIHLYEFLMNSYGSGQMMYKQYFRMINGVFKYRKHLRVNIVAKFLTGEYDLSDFQFFFSLYTFLYPELQSTEERIIVSQQRVQDGINRFFQARLEQKQLESLEKAMSKIRIKGKNSWAYDLDQIAELFIETNIQELKSKIADDYRDLYYSQDTDKRNYMNLESFETVFECIEGGNSDNVDIQATFQSESDKIMNGESLMSLERFSGVCRGLGILSKETQLRYLGENSETYLKTMSAKWEEEQNEIKLRLMKVGKYDMVRRKMLVEINSYMTDHGNGKQHHSMISIHFMVAILIQFSKELILDQALRQYIPLQFILIDKAAKKVKSTEITKKYNNTSDQIPIASLY